MVRCSSSHRSWSHELSHALVARRFGIQVRDITLFIFGGAATLEGDAKTPGQEALIAAGRPASSLVLGARARSEPRW